MWFIENTNIKTIRIALYSIISTDDVMKDVRLVTSVQQGVGCAPEWQSKLDTNAHLAYPTYSPVREHVDG